MVTVESEKIFPLCEYGGDHRSPPALISDGRIGFLD